jgi:DNA polymerase-3 subunit alpha
MSDFIHLHTHSEYSMLDGMSRVSDIVKAVKEDGQKAVAITDHGHLGSVPELLSVARKEDIKPIIGQEFYITPNGGEKDSKVSNNHIILLALDRQGYQLLCYLSSEASKPELFYRRPRIDHHLLRKHSKDLKHIVALSACLSGEIPNAILKGDEKEAQRLVSLYSSLFPNFFFEFMAHGIWKKKNKEEKQFYRDEQLVNETLYKWSKEYNIPLVITNDSHYIEAGQAQQHEYLLAAQTGSKIEDVKRFKFHGTGYHIKTTAEMRQVFDREIWKESLRSMRWIYDNTDIRLPEFTDRKFYIPDAGFKDPDREIARICLVNLKERVKEEDWSRYKKQLKYELGVVKESGFANEFLIVYEYVNWGKKNGIFVGSGRGSMAGVLISYLMRITDVDPIRFNLSFERALNPARPSLPDFDIDFDDKDAIIEHCKAIYGEENVMKIGTFNRMNPRSLLGSVLKLIGMPFQEAVTYTKQLPDTFEIIGAKASGDLKDIFANASGDLGELFERDQRIPELMGAWNGLVKSMGSHAGGVIISDGSKRIRDFIPGTRISEDKELVSQFDKKDVEKLGFIKFDILSIKTLSIIRECIELIGYDPFENFPDTSEINDPQVFELINTGLLKYVFQLDGYACRNTIKTINGIKSFEDIVSVISIARPGTSQFIPEFAENRKTGGKGKYLHKWLKPILDSSYGVILYQEQVMQIAQKIAGFNMIQVDDIKEMIKGKDRAKFDALKPIFIQGAIGKGIKKKIALGIWRMIEASSGYLYNRAHAVSYSLITYQTAWLKAHFPLEFVTACMNMDDITDRNKLELFNEIGRLGVKFLRPDIKKSGVKCIIQENKIRIGLVLIKGIGIKTAEAFVTTRDEMGLKKALKVLPKRVIGAVMTKALKESGALGKKHSTIENQIARLGFPIDDPVGPYQRLIEKESWETDTEILFGGIVSEVRKTLTKKNDEMAYVKIANNGVERTCVLFQNLIHLLKKKMKKGNVIMVYGSKQSGYDTIIPESIQVLSER